MKGLNAFEYETKKHTHGICYCDQLWCKRRDALRNDSHGRGCEVVKLEPTVITGADTGSYLDTANMPDPDLLFVHKGELRLSNFLALAAGIYRNL